MKKKRVLFPILFLLLIISCDRSEPIPVNPTPKPPTVTDVVTPQNVKNYMVDKNASTETAALFYNLRNLGKTKTIIGQHDAFNSFYQNSGSSDIKKTTGNDPGILGSDFMFITDKDNPSNNWYVQQENKIIQDTKDAYAKGMINTFCWHLREPYNEKSFYASDMTTEQKADAFKNLLPGGKFNDWYQKKLDKVASVITNLKDSNGKFIPIIFRPFHEFDGNWFWWGASYSTAEDYIAVYRYTVNYLRDTKNVHNILYAFSPDNSYGNATLYLSRYPGDDYVDILGMDNYGDFDNKGAAGATTANAKLKYISDLANAKNKIAALTETGYRVNSTNPAISNWFSTYLYDAINNNNVQIAYVMFWSNTSNGYYVPTPGTSNVVDFQNFAVKSKIILQNNLPKLYVFP
ncbi:mannan endo-1,4-beta-mannosidase [Cloacibacterium rupense]|uniref:Mannan endo-1,4-beta-mannosidase n=1 Tax=Cloacibacterium rupense TaxID=517423 RepID=A0ABQ2NHA4_9FLAO|nr:glycosyl hydrolase [Cloacibacterium rupense]GGP01998.1 mannan endo-1,4-beta-mannosidase [Cloacibacterium rupense]